VKICLTLFLAGTLAFWGLAAGLVCLLIQDPVPTLSYSAAAAGLCLLPSTLTLVWALAGGGRTAEERRLVVLGGTGLRLFFVLGAALALRSLVPFFQGPSYWVWLLVFYLFTLALEMVLVIRALNAPGQGAEPAPQR
jgi:hypothetical protein